MEQDDGEDREVDRIMGYDSKMWNKKMGRIMRWTG